MYNVLWLNHGLKLQEGNSKSAFLQNLKEKVRQELHISIQTCVTGKDFIWLAENGLEGKKKWDAFVIDAYGNMSEEGISSEIVTRIIDKCKDVIEENNTVLFCFTENEIVSEAVIKVLEQSGFNRNAQNNSAFYKIDFHSVEESMRVFDDLVEVLDEHGKLFKKHPRIKQIYDIIDSVDGKKAILDLLKWKENENMVVEFEGGMREVIDSIEKNLSSLGFFANGGPGSFYIYIDGHKKIDKTKQAWKDGWMKDRKDYLNTDCRSKWESTAMSFLGTFTNVYKHANIFMKPKANMDEKDRLYYECYREMIFRSFEIFSNWYIEFLAKYEANGKNMKLFFNNLDVIDRENSNIEDKEQKDGEVKQLEKNDNKQRIKGFITASHKKDYWGVTSEEGKFIKLDYQEKSDWKGGEKVLFTLDGRYAIHVELMETN